MAVIKFKNIFHLSENIGICCALLIINSSFISCAIFLPIL